MVRAPLHLSKSAIDDFVEKHERWIEKHLKKAEEERKARQDAVPLSYEEVKELADRALAYIPERVRYYAGIMGVDYGRITIRNQRTRWGSCSSKGNLNFNCVLMLTPPEVIDSVVVHELCHLKEMNHSERFYKEVLRVYPEYRRCEKWLKENGGAILRGLRR